MATCDMGFEHTEAPPAPAQPEVILTEPATNEHDVAIAEAEAGARIASDEAFAASRDPELVAENERLRGELEGMRTTLAALQPEPPAQLVEPAPAEPAVTVVEASEPAPPEDAPSPTPPEGKKSKATFWSGYPSKG